MKVVILVMSSEMERYPELVLKQQTTWDANHHQEIETIFYYSSYKTDLVGNKLHVDYAMVMECLKGGELYYHLRKFGRF